MQGKLSEIDIRSILQLIEAGQRTGELFIETCSASYPPNQDISSSLGLHSSSSLPTRSWFVFFLNGQIIYATDSNNNLLRLRDYLRRYQVAATLDNMQVSISPANNIPEYTYLWALLEHNFLTPSQGRSIIHHMIRETLFDLLSLHQGTFIFESILTLSPQLTALKISSTLPKIMQQVQQWKQLHPYITSLHQCPVVTGKLQLHQNLSSDSCDRLEYWADGTTSWRQLSRFLNREVVTVARAIYPFIQKGWVQLACPSPNHISFSSCKEQFSLAQPLQIACIHEDLATTEILQSIFRPHPNIEAVFLHDAPSALGILFQIKPDLIFCDLALSSPLDSYEFCAMLQQSSYFRSTPIIMLSQVEIFIQRIKARMLGATDYLIAPFTEKKILTFLETYLNFRSIIQSSPLLK